MLGLKLIHVDKRDPRRRWANKSTFPKKSWMLIDFNEKSDSVWASNTTWRLKVWSTLVQVVACYLTAPNHWLNNYWPVVGYATGDVFRWIIITHSNMFMNRKAFENVVLKIFGTELKHQCVDGIKAYSGLLLSSMQVSMVRIDRTRKINYIKKGMGNYLKVLSTRPLSIENQYKWHWNAAFIKHSFAKWWLHEMETLPALWVFLEEPTSHE